jgi:hypothetical protein
MTVTRILAEQHRAISHLFAALSCELDRDCRERLTSRLAEELIAHMAVEAAVFLPAVELLLGEPPRDVHAAMRLELRRLLETDPADPWFAARAEAVRMRFDDHVREEEEVLFPWLERAVPAAELDALAALLTKSRPPVWIVMTEGRVDHDAIGAGPCIHMPGVASDEAAR